MRHEPQRTAEQRGQAAAIEWCMAASIEDLIRVAGRSFEDGDALDELIADGITVPASADVEFSLAFFKQVRACVFRCVEAGLAKDRRIREP